jgi:serine/threonine protein kinase
LDWFWNWYADLSKWLIETRILGIPVNVAIGTSAVLALYFCVAWLKYWWPFGPRPAPSPAPVQIDAEPVAPPEVVGRPLPQLPPEYRIERILGRGGFADVFFCRDESGQGVALKQLLHKGNEEELQERRRLFEREVQLLQKLDGEGGFPKIIETRLDYDDPFFVMEFIPGLTLDEQVKRDGPITEMEDIDDLLFGSAGALMIIHFLRIEHRDINPANIIMSDVPRMIDLGIGKEITGASTVTYLTPGTIFYTAPEVLRDQERTPASDVYSWALTMAFALAGKRPFAGPANENTRMRVAEASFDGEFLSGLESASALSPWHNAVVSLLRSCLSVDPGTRPTDGRDVAVAVLALVDTLPQDPAQPLGHTQETLDRMLVRLMMTNSVEAAVHAASEGETPELPPEDVVVDVVRRLLRLPHTGKVLRNGVSAAVLHGAFLKAHPDTADFVKQLDWDAFRSPKTWESLLKRGGIPVTRTPRGLLVFA